MIALLTFTSCSFSILLLGKRGYRAQQEDYFCFSYGLGKKNQLAGGLSKNVLELCFAQVFGLGSVWTVSHFYPDVLSEFGGYHLPCFPARLITIEENVHSLVFRGNEFNLAL
jgi:hypothetical protein